ncbi:hypothetical protein MJH12_07840 [bacterium]|nr:hypothetical protein [bacterium]
MKKLIQLSLLLSLSITSTFSKTQIGFVPFDLKVEKVSNITGVPSRFQGEFFSIGKEPNLELYYQDKQNCRIMALQHVCDLDVYKVLNKITYTQVLHKAIVYDIKLDDQVSIGAILIKEWENNPKHQSFYRNENLRVRLKKNPSVKQQTNFKTLHKIK